MANLNRVLLIGRTTSDIELKTTNSGKFVCTFTLAVNRRFKSDETDFLDVVVWNKTAEWASQYIKKGQAIFVSGSLQVRTWKDNNGNNRKTVEVIADEIQFAEAKAKGETQPQEDFTEVTDEEPLPF
jgi:single-strand DNA-binding protein